jgi:hypothetical protein
LQRLGNVEQRVTGLQLEQGRSPLERAGLDPTTARDGREMLLIGLSQGERLVYHLFRLSHSVIRLNFHSTYTKSQSND